jgi:hypothetical protein
MSLLSCCFVGYGVVGGWRGERDDLRWELDLRAVGLEVVSGAYDRNYINCSPSVEVVGTVVAEWVRGWVSLVYFLIPNISEISTENLVNGTYLSTEQPAVPSYPTDCADSSPQTTRSRLQAHAVVPCPRNARRTRSYPRQSTSLGPTPPGSKPLLHPRTKCSAVSGSAACSDSDPAGRRDASAQRRRGRALGRWRGGGWRARG